ncbi:hypothetical protein O2W18_15330 [Modestobacter sp. VKM Ac-2983]|uniref:hypothetical protein n=1 Tax=Modestobacter sp. VKM Ac-2983 TaxID=3004137 RepID=UPI0022ABC5A3|nr:hypothetical protein [Modestobacter sp. VKM Ac-2983]MCZ2806481.1 hypothetical protein [Modestobacter sp. VKM Ac-2983]
MTRPPAWARVTLALAIALCTVAGLLSVAASTAPASPELQTAADTNQFDPGNIISDAMFFDHSALTAQQTQDFIAAKGANCRASSAGVPCLKDYRENTFTRAPDGICDGWYHGAAGESAGMIIWKVGQACHLSPKALLVLLQKEQALVTATGSGLTARRYQIAAGMGCPDTAACDTQYYGFYNQVYSAARQYQRYATYPRNYAYRAGLTNTIYWSPTASCGTSQVYIANQATAGLYNYTPYRPNSAALRAGYGIGDSCSAYGNRNFFLYFSDWFGSTQSPGGDAIIAAYADRGGASGPLGPWVTWVICGLPGGGCGQVFQNATLYWSPASGAHAVKEPYLSAWGRQREGGPLGYPTSEEICGLKDGGCGQIFQGGRIYSTWSTGTHAVRGAIESAWIAQGWEAGPLGYPTTDLSCGMKEDGCGQTFQGGVMYASPGTGAHALSGEVRQVWSAQGYENGPLGYPISGYACGMAQGGCGQAFQGGRIYSTWSTGTRILSGPIQTAWTAQGWENGPLGYPRSDQVCGLADGGCRQEFQGGAIYSSPTAGAFPTSGTIAAAWQAAGGEDGPLGYPVTGVICGMKESGCGQVFEDGRVYSTPATGAHAITGTMHRAWVAQGYEVGKLGYPTGAAVCGLAGGGCEQQFQGGTLYSHPTAGTNAVSGVIATAWAAAGGEGGGLGYPITGLICGMKESGCGQVFQGGRIYSTPGTGAHAMTGVLHAAWMAQGYEVGKLGYPTGAADCGLAGGGCEQQFQGGTLYTHLTAGNHTVSGAIATAWQAAGGEGGPLGYPTTGLICGLKNGGCGQVFQGGRVYDTPATGARALSGPIHTTWVAQGWETGPLGYATGDQVCGLADGGCRQQFQGGTLYTSPASGTFPVVPGAVGTAWTEAGAEGSPLGYPTSGLICGLRNGGCGQVFQGGRVYHTADTGGHSISGAIQDAWIGQGWETGPLGYPTSEAYAVPGGTAQDFQGGKLVLDQATGTVTRG